MYYGKKKGSCIGFDMALEKVYNKLAKVIGGIIGETARKEAIALWNMTKHESDLHVVNLEEWCDLDEDDSELSLHHEFTVHSAIANNN